MRREEAVAIARLAAFLAEVERLSQRGAERQAALAGGTRWSRFLARQARQEAVHAAVFSRGAALLAPRGLRAAAPSPGLAVFAALLDEAIARRELATTLLLQQVLLEGLGDRVLAAIDTGIQARGLGLGRLRQTLIRQEHAHHRFGRWALDRMAAARPERSEALTGHAARGLAAIDQVLDDMQVLFDHFDESRAAYAEHVRRALPAWLAP